MNIEQARFNMIEQQIRPWNVLDDTILKLLAQVKREQFVPLAHKALAFADLEIPLMGNGDAAQRLGQCMLEPKMEARLLQDAAVQPHENVLEIGTGSGYMAALLASRARRVTTLEIEPALVALARTNLQAAGIHNVEVRQGDGAHFGAADASYDVIVLSGSVAEVPTNLLTQLRVGGRMCAIVGEEPVMRATTVTRNSETDFCAVQGWDTVAPRLRNFPQPSRFRF